MPLTKKVMSNYLIDACAILNQQSGVIVELKELVDSLKTEAIGDKNRVIKLQEDLLESKDTQLHSLRSRQL